MDNEKFSREYSLQEISSWTPEELLEAFTYEIEPYANSAKGWAMVLSEGYSEETIKQVIQSLHWQADQMKRATAAVREYLKKHKEM
jgi:hypothetical protein